MHWRTFYVLDSVRPSSATRLNERCAFQLSNLKRREVSEAFEIYIYDFALYGLRSCACAVLCAAAVIPASLAIFRDRCSSSSGVGGASTNEALSPGSGVAEQGKG